METVCVVAKPALSDKWQEWIDALVSADIKVRNLAPDFIESPPSEPHCGRIFIVDGMLPDLTGIALGIVSQYPDAKLIVASDCDSFTIYYEVLQMGAIYVPASLPPDHMVATVREGIASRQE